MHCQPQHDYYDDQNGRQDANYHYDDQYKYEEEVEQLQLRNSQEQYEDRIAATPEVPRMNTACDPSYAFNLTFVVRLGRR